MSLQAALREFDQTIKLDWYGQSALLREKRDRVLTRMRNAGLQFDAFNQGSYAMRLGVRPINGDFDIDVGIILKSANHLTPTEAKRLVYNAVSGHTSQVEWRRHCIRVQYKKAGEAAFHVDLAVYRQHMPGLPGLVLAAGKQHSADPEWIRSDPKGLIRAFDDRFREHSLEQFRRVVRMMKRWKDLHFSSEGNAAPVGIGIAMSGYTHFSPSSDDDLQALRGLVQRMRLSFGYAYGPDRVWGRRIVEKVPVIPQDDVYRRMTNQQMREYEQRLAVLRDAIDEALRGDGYALQQEFGPDLGDW